MNNTPIFQQAIPRIIVSASIAIAATSSFAAETSQDTTELSTIEVIGTTPLRGSGISLEKYPGNVQFLDSDQIDEQNAVDLSDLLFRNLGSVDINSAQNNPFQNDVNYRGFLASPLVGTAIGISAFVDGVRVNEGFGDTVNWDLIPDFAISDVTLIPGSNPLFGLNTLGGSISLQTKDGSEYDETGAEFYAGSFGRRSATVDHGGNAGNIDWYFGGNIFSEDGWRDRSPSDVKQFFAKIGWKNSATDIDLSYSHADNDLIGNGFVPESHLAVSREAVYTFPDQTENELHFFNLQANHEINNALSLAGNVFYRDFQRNTLNGDAELGCETANTTINDCDQGDLETEGEERRTQTDTDNIGTTLQLTHAGNIGSKNNTFTLGTAFDRSKTRFITTEAEGTLFQEGIAFGVTDPEDSETEVDINTERENWAIYFTDTLDLTSQVSLNLSGRYQHTTIEIADLTGEPENLDLNGKHKFSRFNPAVGLNYNPNKDLTLYAGYNESFRTPTAAELTCADPDDPCNLPNAFVADPPLDPVIGKTFEIGARGSFVRTYGWSAALFRTELEDDLLFTTTTSTGAGFFQNVPETRRQGIELGINGLHSRFAWFANYSYVEATFESDVLLASVVQPTGIAVRAGDEFPAIPEHNVKLGADFYATDKLTVGATMTYASGTFLRGDENNQLAKTDDYAVFNLNASYQANDNMQFWVKVDNVFDTDYENSGVRNFNAFPAGGGDIQEERFLSPGAPFAAWIGLKLRFE